MPADFSDRTDFDNANRGGLIGGVLEPAVIHGGDGSVVYDAAGFAEATAGDCPDSVNANLWRQAQLTSVHGLFEVTDGIYQIRGYDLSNMTLVEGDTGVVVIDPLVSSECAAAGLALYRRHRGERPVSAVIYTHSHVDHFGGVLGVVDVDTTVPIVAPEHFLEHAVSENVYAGTAMLRRSMYHTGIVLPVGATGTLGAGLGPSTSTGTVGLIAPDARHHPHRTGRDLRRCPDDLPGDAGYRGAGGDELLVPRSPSTVSGRERNSQSAQPADIAGGRTGARRPHLVAIPHRGHRDVRLRLRCRLRVPSLAHLGGTDELLVYLTQQRDLYAYLHDQTLRRMNQGYVGSEIAEDFPMPPVLDAAWHARGFYGSVSHNVKAIYQRYLGWYDGNPAHLWQHPPEAAAARYVRALGGVEAAVAKAQEFADEGDLRFAAELAGHAVFAQPDHAGAKKKLLAQVFTKLGYGSECANWRNNFLAGATSSSAGRIPHRSAGPKSRARSPSPNSSTVSPSASTARERGTCRRPSDGTSPTPTRPIGWSSRTVS